MTEKEAFAAYSEGSVQFTRQAQPTVAVADGQLRGGAAPTGSEREVAVCPDRRVSLPEDQNWPTGELAEDNENF